MNPILKKYRIFILIFVVLALTLSIGIQAYGRKSPRNEDLLSNPFSQRIRKTVFTQNKNSESLKSVFLKKAKSIVRKSGQVEIVSDGRFFKLESSAEPGPELLILKTTDEFYGAPDHHSSLKFKLLAIEEKGAEIGYESRFDHASFGKSMITIDRGSLRVAWKEPRA